MQVPGVNGAAPVEAHTTDPVSGGLDLPEGASVVAWWGSGAAPGGAGSVVLAGHVSYKGRPARSPGCPVPVGREVVVASADGGTHRYAVGVRRGQVRAGPRGAVQHDGTPALVLVTCGGAYDPATHSFEANIVVTATPTA